MSDREVMSALGEVLGFLGKLTEKVEGLSVKVDRIESTMATKAELRAVEARLDARIDENRQETVACKLAVAELTGVVSALSKATTENTTAIGELQQATAANTTAIGELQQSVGELQQSVGGLQRATASNTAAIDALGGQLAGHLRQTVEYINADRREISELRGGLDCLGQRFDALVRPPAAAE